MKTIFLAGALTCAVLASSAARADGAGAAPRRPSDEKVACVNAASKSQQFRDAHKLVEARAELRQCVAAQCPAVVRDDCTNWLGDVERARDRGASSRVGGCKRAQSKRNAAESLCPTSQCQTTAGVDAWNDVASTQTISTVGFIAGGVVVAGAVVLWFTAPRSSSGPSAQVSVGPGSVRVMGTW